MRAVRTTRTAPELAVAKIVSELGFRFRRGVRSLPGSPDLANKSRRWVIFVHGCFWHAHVGCRAATVPKSNTDFWVAKLERNRMRDAEKRAMLRKAGFLVLTVWQCEIKRPDVLQKKLQRALADR